MHSINLAVNNVDFTQGMIVTSDDISEAWRSGALHSVASFASCRMYIVFFLHITKLEINIEHRKKLIRSFCISLALHSCCSISIFSSKYLPARVNMHRQHYNISDVNTDQVT